MLLSRDFQNPRMTLRKFRSLEKEKWPQSQLGLDSESGCVCVCVYPRLALEMTMYGYEEVLNECGGDPGNGAESSFCLRCWPLVGSFL